MLRFGGMLCGKEYFMLLRQLFDKETSTYTYLLADSATGEAALIDPVKEQIERDLSLLRDLGLTLRWVLETHVHADHVTAAGLLRERTGAKTAASAVGAPCVDRGLSSGDTVEVGGISIRVLQTPGHTDDGISYFVPEGGGQVFTGDTLLVRGCGRSDFQNGNPSQLFRSINEVLFRLPPATTVWPGHDYKGHSQSTIAEEIQFNPRISGKSEAEFIAIMNALNLPKPAKIDIAVPANRACGSIQDQNQTTPAVAPDIYDRSENTAGGWREATVQMVAELGKGVHLVDVREPDEWAGELGVIDGAERVSLGSVESAASKWDKSQTLVLVCRSGNRSGKASAALQSAGFTRLVNMTGGMLAWNAAGLPVAKA
jgi:glyoxylase-like metal-dependent hydrolase (beta-lactamase superfamily II)/rhodanese-related sulfurtransferase